MKCWSCDKDIPGDAKFCPHCEAPAEEAPTEAEKAAFTEAIGALAPEIMDELRDVFEKSASGEEFVNRIMVGECPKCESAKTGDCEHDPEIDDPCVGRCFDCGQLWCLDCEELFKAGQPINHDCPAWAEMDFDDELEE
ncbi:MAG: hypothetical protein ACR2NU_01840 [Aeoliella sp.]